MENLREQIDITSLGSKKLTVGNEYYITQHNALGIFLGKRRGTNYFTCTHSSKDHTNLVTLFSSINSWRFERFGDLNIYRYFIPIYKKLCTNILNLKDLPIISTYSGYFIPIQSDQFTTTDLVKPVYTDKLNKVLENIIRTSSKTSSDYKIAKHITGKLPVDICGINEIGLLSFAASEKEVQVFTLSRDKALKIINKVDRFTREERQHFSENRDALVIKNLEQTKIGRVIKRFSGELFTDTQIESFVSLFNSKTINLGTYKFELVEGDVIGKWYNKTSYTKDAHGTLHNSCMAHSNLGHQWRFYQNHPNVKMIILTMGEMLHARALVWTLTTGEKYLDRVYYTTETEKKMILNWATEQGITLRYEDLTSDKTETSKRTLLVETNLVTFDQDACFPYFDTFNCVTANGKHLVRIRGNIDDKRTTLTHEDMYYLKYQLLSVGRGTGSIRNFIDLYRRYKSNKYHSGSVFLEESECMAYNAKTGTRKPMFEKDCTFDPERREMVVNADYVEEVKEKKTVEENFKIFKQIVINV